MGQLNLAQLNHLKTIAEEGLSKSELYTWINNNFADEGKRKHAKQAVRRWIRQEDPNRTRKTPDIEDGPTGICAICNGTYHNSEIQFVQLNHYDTYHHVCNDCCRDRRERGLYIMSDHEFKSSTVSAGNPKKEGEHGKTNHVGAFSNTIRTYGPNDWPTQTKDPNDFNNRYDGDIRTNADLTER